MNFTCPGSSGDTHLHYRRRWGGHIQKKTFPPISGDLSATLHFPVVTKFFRNDTKRLYVVPS